MDERDQDKEGKSRFDRPVQAPPRAGEIAPKRRRDQPQAAQGGVRRYEQGRPRPPASDRQPGPGSVDSRPPQGRPEFDRPAGNDRPDSRNDRPAPGYDHRGPPRERQGGGGYDRSGPPRDRPSFGQGRDAGPGRREERPPVLGFTRQDGPRPPEREFRDRGQRATMAADMVTGIHAVEALARFQPQRVQEIHLWSTDPRLVTRMEALAKQQKLRLIREAPVGVDPEGPNAQGVAARLTPFRYADLDLLVPVTGARPGTLVVVLDSITDPRNLGAILRSAAFFQATAVVLPTDRAAEVTSLVERIAEGGTASVPVVQVVNLSRTLKELRERGVEVVGTALDGATGDLRDHKWSPATAIVLGAEGVGIRPLVRKNCDVLLTLQGPETMPSLNVAAFATLTLAQARAAHKPG